ncbi:MAG: TIR domain-containing protein [Nitrosomonas sp.]|nr:TIR domain-containing protein [Nitrosomonas sp.]
MEEVVQQLKIRGVSLFYDLDEKATLWGKDLHAQLADVYRNKARYTLMFISLNYKKKYWTNHERQAAQSRAFEEKSEYILPARFDDTEIPGLLPTIQCIDLRIHTPEELALLVCKKLGKSQINLRSDQVLPPRNPELSGEVSFNYSSFNGHYRIGEKQFEFETHWSKASNMSIHCYTDSTNLRGIALAPRGIDFKGMPSVEKLDFTSRVRTPEVGRFVVLQNYQGFYAILQILEVKDDTRGDDEDFLRFKYWILQDGSAYFAQLTFG